MFKFFVNMKNMRILFCSCLTILIYGYVSEIYSCGITWDKFKDEYKKKYDSNDTEKYRQGIFNNNCRIIEEHNKKYDNDKIGVSFKMGMNKFGDLTHKEFEKMFSTDNHGAGCTDSYEIVDESNDGFDDLDNTVIPKPPPPPPTMNWTAKGKVGAVVDQGNCSAGWAYSAIDAAWSGLFIKNNNTPPKLSMRFAFYCTTGQGSKDCHCGHAFDVFNVAKKTGGIPDEISFENNVSDCNRSQSTWDCDGFNVCDGEKKSYVNAMSLRNKLVNGPVVVSIWANGSSFQFAKEGVYNEVRACNQTPNHEVLVVGYDHDEVTKRDYWIVKNSFGTSWGNNGYFNIHAFNHTEIFCSVLCKFTFPKFGENCKKC